jgi:sporulation protein YlmC with PRC-barrel domain
MQLRAKLCAGAATGALIVGVATAQPAQQQPAQQQQQPAQQQQVAEQCLRDLQALNERMQQDGYWIAGWGARWGTPARGAADAPATTGRAPAAIPGAGTAGGPWGTPARFGIHSPRYQIQILHAATNVLAHRGDQQACAQVMGELREVYTGYVAELQQAGIEPGRVTTWRQDRIIAAQPVQQLNRAVSVDEVTGTEVRNAQDERLGSIHDVIMDPQSGQISHVVLARGGFFGLGADHVVVPWQTFRATPDLNLFVLNVAEPVVEGAPTVDLGLFGDQSVFQRERQQADQYWQKHTAG